MRCRPSRLGKDPVSDLLLALGHANWKLSFPLGSLGRKCITGQAPNRISEFPNVQILMNGQAEISVPKGIINTTLTGGMRLRRRTPIVGPEDSARFEKVDMSHKGRQGETEPTDDDNDTVRFGSDECRWMPNGNSVTCQHLSLSPSPFHLEGNVRVRLLQLSRLRCRIVSFFMLIVLLDRRSVVKE